MLEHISNYDYVSLGPFSFKEQDKKGFWKCQVSICIVEMISNEFINKLDSQALSFNTRSSLV